MAPGRRDAPDLILASGSPARRRLFARLGRPFTVLTPGVDESFPPGADPRAIALELARRKAQAVARELASRPDGRAAVIVAADTVAALRDDVLGKPADAADAVAVLSRLAGTRHAVITGVCVIHTGNGRSMADSETTWVTMRNMSRREIERYVAGGESRGRAGAYAIQETGDRYVEKIEGDFTNVVGLPLELVERMLEEIERPPP